MGLNVLSLFSGIGGPDLAAQAAGMTTVGFVEWDPWCQALLHQHWPTVPVWGDIREFTKEAFDERRGTIAFSDTHGGMATDGRECALAAGEGIGGRNDRTGSDSNDWQVANGTAREGSVPFSDTASIRLGGGCEDCAGQQTSVFGQEHQAGRVDLITGGFPCQPFSTAGKRRGTDDTRYLWPEMLRVIEEFQPAWVVGENVAGFVGMGLDIALAGLEGEGYEATAFMVPALAVGTPHLRQRVFIVAHNMRIGQQEQPQCDSLRGRSASEARSGDGAGTGGGSDRGNRPKGAGVGAGDPCVLSTPVAHSDCARSEGSQASRNDGENGTEPHDQFSRGCGNARGGRSSQPRLGGTPDGLSGWLDKVREQTLWQGDWEGETPRVTQERNDVANRLKALGNACVPSQIYPIFKAIADIEGATLWN